jgi:hypothetical protein
MPRGPGGASIERSSALHLPTAAFSTASRACDVASDALCHSPIRAGSAFRLNLPGETARHRLRRRLVKDDRFADARTPSLDECSLPCKSGLRFRFGLPGSRPLPAAAFAVAERRRIIDSPPPCSRLCRREPASDTLSPPEHEAGRLDPTLPAAVTRRGGWLGPGASRRLLQPEQSTSTTTGSTDPRSGLVDAARPACAELGGTLRMGLKPSAMSTAGSGWCSAALAARTLRPGRAVERSRGPIRHVVLHQPRSHGPGAGRLSPPGTSRLAAHPYETHALLGAVSCSRHAPATRASPQPDPLGHLMSRDRGAPDGEPGACGARRRPPRNKSEASSYGAPPTIPPRKPCTHA